MAGQVMSKCWVFDSMRYVQQMRSAVDRSTFQRRLVCTAFSVVPCALGDIVDSSQNCVYPPVFGRALSSANAALLAIERVTSDAPD